MTKFHGSFSHTSASSGWVEGGFEPPVQNFDRGGVWVVGVWFGFRREGVVPFIKKKRCQNFFYYIKKQKKISACQGGPNFSDPVGGGYLPPPPEFLEGGLFDFSVFRGSVPP